MGIRFPTAAILGLLWIAEPLEATPSCAVNLSQSPFEIADSLQFPVPSYSVTGFQFAEIVRTPQVRHLGEDVVLPPGTPVVAIGNGNVIYSCTNVSNYGQVIVIEHQLTDGTFLVSVYGHLSHRQDLPLRSIGPVRRGEIIGFVGDDNENGDGGPHLHLGIRKGPHASKWVYYGRSGRGEDVDVDLQGNLIGGLFTRPSAFIGDRQGPTITISNPAVICSPGPKCTGPQGTSFDFAGTGFTPNSTTRRFIVDSKGNQTDLLPVLSADSSGRVSWSFTSTCSTPVGTFSVFAVDEAGGKTSNHVAEIITPGACPLPPPLLTCALSASPGRISVGGSSTLSWTTTGNPTAATIDSGIGSVNPAGGSLNVSPSASTTYTMTVTNSTGSTTCTTSVTLNAVGLASGKFAYVANLGSNNVSGFTIHPDTGALTPIAGSPFPAGERPMSVTVDPTGRFAYVSNLGFFSAFAPGSISAYTIDASTGVLIPIPGSPFPIPILAAAGASSATIDPAGKFLYAELFDPSSGAVAGFAIDPNSGALTPVPGSPFAVGLGSSPIALHPNGKFAYVRQNIGNSVNLLGFTIDSTTGTLSPVPGSPVPGGASLFPITIDPTGKFVYLPDTIAGGVLAFVIDGSTGALTPVPGSPFPATVAISVAVDPAGKFAYVVDNNCGIQTGTVTGFSIDSSSGALTQIASPFPAGGCPQSMIMHPNGKFGYVTTSEPPSVIGYAIEAATGALSVVPGSPFQAGSSNFPINLPLTLDPSGRFAYVANQTMNIVSAFLIDPTTGTLTPSPGSPFSAGASPQSVTITGHPSPQPGSNVGDSVDIPMLVFPGPIALLPSGAQALIGDLSSANLKILDPATGQVRLTLVTGLNSPVRIAAERSGTPALVLDCSSISCSNPADELVRVDILGGTKTPIATGFSRARGLAVEAGGGTALVSDNFGLQRVNLATGVVTHVADVCGGDVAILPGGATVVCPAPPFSINKIDLATGTVTTVPISLIGSYRGDAIEVSPDGTFAYIVGSPADTGIERVDLVTGGATVVFNSGIPGFGGFSIGDLALMPSGNEIEFTLFTPEGAQVRRLNLTDGALSTVNRGINPVAIEEEATGGTVLATGSATFGPLVRLNIITGTTQLFQTFVSPNDIAVLPSGTEALVVAGRFGDPTGDLWRVDLITSSPSKVASLVNLGGVVVEPGGQTVLVTSGGGVSRVDLGTGTATIIAQGIANASGISLMGSAQEVLVTGTDGLTRVNLMSGNTTLVAALQAGYVAVEPGDETALVSSGGSLLRVDLATGSVTTLFRDITLSINKILRESDANTALIATTKGIKRLRIR